MKIKKSILSGRWEHVEHVDKGMTKGNDHDYVSSLGVWETVEYLVTV